jgi:hypothetical protein
VDSERPVGKILTVPGCGRKRKPLLSFTVFKVFAVDLFE